MYNYVARYGAFFLLSVSVKPALASDFNSSSPRERNVDILYSNIELKSQEKVIDTSKSAIQLGTGQEAEINRAILLQNWQQLKRLLINYRQQPDFDEVLYDYALGALLRSQGKHNQAIKTYKKLLKNNPDFHYIGFDVGVMMFENKQYEQAKRQIVEAKPHLTSDLQKLAEEYLIAIEKKQQVRPSFHINYEKNNNVNNASSVSEIVWQGRRWKKSAESLPQKANGVRSGVSIARDVNVNNNHFVSVDVGFDGVHFWDNPSYDEQRINANLGYKYQDVKQNISFLPFVEYSWFDDDLYTEEQGVYLAWQRSLSPKTKLNTSVRYTDKNYRDQHSANRYDSHTTSSNVMLSYAIKPNVVMFGGVDVSRENAKDDEYSYHRMGGNIGVMAEKSSSFGGQISLRYAQRQFQQPERLVYNFKREDDEYYLQTMLWHNKLQYKGFLPQLNVRYNKINSNMDGFYSRDGVQSFISVEKQF